MKRLKRPPPRKDWPEGLRAACRAHRGLYGKLDVLRVLAPLSLTWLLLYWDTLEGLRVIEALHAQDVYEFIDRFEHGESCIRINPHDSRLLAALDS